MLRRGWDWFKLGSNDDTSMNRTFLEGWTWMGVHPHFHLCCLLQNQGDAESKGLQKLNGMFLLTLE